MVVLDQCVVSQGDTGADVCMLILQPFRVREVLSRFSKG